jgi:hypothetical protein
MLGIFIAYPWLAFIVAAAMLLLYFSRHSRSAVLAFGLWFLYGVYEYLMHSRVLCSGECNIRVDLLALYPALIAVTGVAVVRSFWRRRTD